MIEPNRTLLRTGFCGLVFIAALAVFAMLLSCGTKEDAALSALEWPPVSRECKPWTYWWWMGSAVDRENLTKNLEEYSSAGIGGVHVVPIYGVKGYENRFIPYLSREWMDMLAHAANEAVRLGMGIDMTTGTGWPYGGPQVGPDDAASRVRIEKFAVSGGEHFTHTFDRKSLQALMAYPRNGQAVDLLDFVDMSTGAIDWNAPAGQYAVYAVFREGTGQQVKRAAPGGEGNVLDYFSRYSLKHYLARFDSAFSAHGKSIPLRAFYNDSYEVYGSNWTYALFSEFIRLRAYDLRYFLAELNGDGPDDLVARVRHDYNETVSDMLREQFTVPWVQWAHEKGSFTRNQAHGSPGNLLDLYAAADIPETEAFGTSRFPIPGLRIDPDMPEESGHPDILVSKFASSAAHVTGKKLVSSESCTWLGEHFKVALSQVKPEIDALLVSGVNHVFFHGIAYSPKEAAWPGWLFYASTNFGQSNPFWRDLPELNAYIARCQSFLQTGRPANDVLLYWPVHDRWRTKADEDMLHHFQVHNASGWFYGTPFHEATQMMWDRGYTFDYISDRLIADVTIRSGILTAVDVPYKTIVIPDCRFMPAATLEKLLALVRDGARVIFIGDLPGDVPGLSNLGRDRFRLAEMNSEFKKGLTGENGIKEAKVGKGRVYIGQNLEELLTRIGISRETVADHGVEFVRRTHERGYHYFMTNLGDAVCDGWIPLGVDAQSVVLFDPVTGEAGWARVEQNKQGTRVYLRLEPGRSCILRTYTDLKNPGQTWKYLSPGDGAVEITGPWTVTFLDGGPRLPKAFTTESLRLWTEAGDNDAHNFSGTARYSTTFEKPSAAADEWILDLGGVFERARVRLNGANIGAVWCIPFTIRIGDALRDGKNTLEIDVTNCGANRIADMDRRKVPWKMFYDINFVNIKYQPFDASSWPPFESGLRGPVMLCPASVH